MRLQVVLIWECFALNLKPQGQFIDESGEGLAFAINIVVMRLGIVAQMLNLYSGMGNIRKLNGQRRNG